DDPRGALRWSLSHLRPIVDDASRPRLIANRETVALDLNDVDVDFHRLLAAAREAETAPVAELLSAAVPADGVLLAGLDLPESHEYQAWLVAERETARRAAKQLLRKLLPRLEPGSDDALASARRLVAIAPEEEDAHATLIGALIASGRRGEAEQQATI